MKIIDKNGRIFGKISIIDIIILLSVLFLAFSVLYSRFSDANSIVSVGKQETALMIQIKAYGVFDTEKAPFSVGDSIYGNGGEIIGKITNVVKKPNVAKFKLIDGTYIDCESAEYVDYFLTVVGSAVETEKGLFAAGTLPLIPNNNVVISSSKYNGNSIVLSVEKTA